MSNKPWTKAELDAAVYHHEKHGADDDGPWEPGDNPWMWYRDSEKREMAFMAGANWALAKSSERADKLAVLLYRLRANHPTTKGDQWGVSQKASGLETSALWREVDAALAAHDAGKEGT